MYKNPVFLWTLCELSREVKFFLEDQMSYRNMSNREGNFLRIMEMHEENMSPVVIAAYMTEWKVPMTAQDVNCVINIYEPMGLHAVKKQDVQQAIKTDKLLKESYSNTEAVSPESVISTLEI